MCRKQTSALGDIRKSPIAAGSAPSAVPAARKSDPVAGLCYGAIFKHEAMDVQFVSAGNSKDVQTDRLAIMATLHKLAKGVRIIPLIDHDDHSDADVTALEATGYRVLSRRQIESYLFADEVLNALCDAEGKPEAKSDVLRIKADAIAASVTRGNVAEDIKKAAGDIVVGLRTRLSLLGRGNVTEAVE